MKLMMPKGLVNKMSVCCALISALTCHELSAEGLPAQAPVAELAARPSDPWLERFLEVAQESPDKRARRALKEVLKDPQRYRFQLLISEYQLLDSGEETLTPHEFRVDAEYFYPASAIKTFGSVAALRTYTKLRRTDTAWLTTNDPMSQGSKACKTADSTELKLGLATLEHEIKKTQLISSNRAFNTVFNISGFRALHEELIPDFPSLRVFHRLSSRETHEESLVTPSLRICDSRDFKGSGQKRARKRVGQRRAYSRERFTSKGDITDLTAQIPSDAPTGFGQNRESLKVGGAHRHMKSNKLIREPMDFSLKNRASFYDFQRLNIGLYMPDRLSPFGDPIKVFSTKADPPPIRSVWLDELRHAMAIYPRHSENPKYSGASLSETRFKPMIKGVRRASKRLSDQRLYYLNKAGKALGFHMDNAFIAYGNRAGEIKKNGLPSQKPQRGLFVTVGVYVNRNGVLNDNEYEYKTISAPLLNAIGYAVGTYLTDQKRFATLTAPKSKVEETQP